MARYAEGTTVTVDQSRAQITGILAGHGVLRMAWATEPEGDRLQFEMDGRAYRFAIARPTVDEIHRLFPNHRDTDSKIAAEWRRRWRANVLLLKAKLEFADGETSTVERELLPYAVMRDGRTVMDALDSGSLPLLTAKAGA
jgi:hypothetical protein